MFQMETRKNAKKNENFIGKQKLEWIDIFNEFWIDILEILKFCQIFFLLNFENPKTLEILKFENIWILLKRLVSFALNDFLICLIWSKWSN